MKISTHATRLLEASRERLNELTQQQKLVEEFAADMALLSEAVAQPEETEEAE
jgi:hypothetical protein